MNNSPIQVSAPTESMQSSEVVASPAMPPAKELGLAATVLLSTLVTLLVLSPIAYTAYRNLPPRVATVDLQALVEDDQQGAIKALGGNANGVASEEQRTAYLKKTADFGKKLNESIEALSQQCRCVIVNKAAVLGGTTVDYTEGIRQRMAKP